MREGEKMIAPVINFNTHTLTEINNFAIQEDLPAFILETSAFGDVKFLPAANVYGIGFFWTNYGTTICMDSSLYNLSAPYANCVLTRDIVDPSSTLTYPRAWNDRVYTGAVKSYTYGDKVMRYTYMSSSAFRKPDNIESVGNISVNVEPLAIAYYGSLRPITNPIIYIPINSVLSGPESAASGETVNVSVSFPDGYIYQEQGVSIYNKDGAIPFSYVDGTLSFVMP